ncbi:hypothetical protein FHX81_1786 [Saccharothrix saharensis]|uniref:Uncharacterized protein n=1 Tax=Saccharothrix saharensis TaxID=571190 RepID=A0A543J9J5_9PSEU|nr:hypothetical protein FHX81_1786 [Saccharothrix saharensis]
MRNQAAVTERRTGKKARPGPEAETPSFSRAQLLALLVGLLQIVFASVPFLPMGEGAVHTLYVCTGLAGVLLAWRHRHARCYGVLLLLLYGQLFITDAEDTAVLGLPTWETLAYGRAALAGVVIALVPAIKRR